jgi:murein L,D-transpeptidase YafK
MNEAVEVKHAMHRWRLGRWGVITGFAVALLAGCVLGPEPPPQPPLADEDRIDWAAGEPWFVVVRTSCRTLDVYRYGDRVRSYPAVFGLGGTGGKFYEGDRRTPSGLYAIVDVRPHPRWRWFLLLDYPNLDDVRRYEVAIASGRIPMLGNRPVAVGGAIGIHGTDKPELNRKNVDWTFGCISLGNDEVADLAGLVPVGTPVLIED